MARANSISLQHSDLYNRIEDWITESNAARTSHQAQIIQSSLPQPVFYPVHPLPRAFDRYRHDEVTTTKTNHEGLPSNLTKLQEEWLDRQRYHAQRGVTNCYASDELRPQARVGQMASLKSWVPQQSLASSTANDLARPSTCEERGRQGYERRPRHRTRNDRYEYKVKNKRSSERPFLMRRANNDSFHAPNVPCERLTLNQRRKSGIFGRGKASSPVRTRGGDQVHDFFGFDTILNLDRTRANAGFGFSESEFLRGSNADRVVFHNPSCGHLEENSGSTASRLMHKSVVSDATSTVALCRSRDLSEAGHITTDPKGMDTFSEPATNSYVSALENPPRRGSEVHHEKQPSSHLMTLRYKVEYPNTWGCQHCCNRLQEGVSQNWRHPPDTMRSDEIAANPSDKDKADGQKIKERVIDKKAAAVPVHANNIDQSLLPNVNTCWQPTLEPNSGSVADTEEFDYETIMGARLRGKTSHNNLPQPLIKCSSERSPSVFHVGTCGENLLAHESQIRQTIEEPDHESMGFTVVPEDIDCCSEIASLIDIEEWETTSVVVDMDTDIDTQVLSVATSSGAICNDTKDIRGRLEAVQLGTNIQETQPLKYWKVGPENTPNVLAFTDSMWDTSSAAKGSQMRDARQLSVHESVASEATNTSHAGPWLASLSRRRPRAIGTGIDRLNLGTTDGLGTFWHQRMGY
ncbi:hypothetical protein AbraIFM66951_006834 [Aspergillus brasiliensis]|uniref:Uncharacterized protein n=1 Tax=Aspergillus brasiliensis TaxID=319629 RepID=A0A9W5YHE4_9EURO|nr:hypothetical protein AbraCBS73388_007199 [Aspergillus brasiliensis]GKZ44602.1 hypothetical protein AbraIFM66951_006834 [Aspergillus brasiliensis]